VRVELNEESGLTSARFIKGLSPFIANEVDLQPYLSFDDVYNLAIEVVKQLKGTLCKLISHLHKKIYSLP